jgi:membrane protein
MKTEAFFKERFIAVGLNFLLTFVLLIAFTVFILGNFVVKMLAKKDLIQYDFTFYLTKSLTYLIIFSVFFFTISIIYYYAPAIHKRWKFLMRVPLLRRL